MNLDRLYPHGYFLVFGRLLEHENKPLWYIKLTESKCVECPLYAIEQSRDATALKVGFRPVFKTTLPGTVIIAGREPTSFPRSFRRWI